MPTTWEYGLIQAYMTQKLNLQMRSYRSSTEGTGDLKGYLVVKQMDPEEMIQYYVAHDRMQLGFDAFVVALGIWWNILCIISRDPA